MIAAIPLAAGAFAATCLALAIAFYFRRQLPRAAASLLTLLLIGYAFGDRGFAYLGIPPVYIGEVVLAVSLLAMVAAGRLARPFGVTAAMALIAFLAVGAISTLPFVGEHGLDAIRDGVLWAYGLFAIAILCLADLRVFDVAERRFASAVPWFLLLVPIFINVQRWAPQLVPRIGSEGVPIILLKTGDVAVHLAGIAAFLILGLGRRDSRLLSSAVLEWGIWALWLISFALVSDTRGGMVSIICAVTIVVVLRVRSRWAKPLVVAVVGIALAAGLQIEAETGRERNISVADIFVRLQSTFQTTGVDQVDGTKSWRVDWWEKVVDYTVFGPYRWLGKGYGINLADDDGFQVEADGSLRSPHSVHVTILARSGLVGLATWTAFLVTLSTQLLRVAVRSTSERHRKLAVWLLAYGAAFVVNATFDVYLEGPQGGIWFWAVVGAALVLISDDRSDYSREMAVP